jgi:ABC-type proline/glycine betaine transport system permease subunit
MKLAEKFKNAVRFVFAPGAASYDQWRHLRTILLSILIAAAVAVGFGLLLYNLNQSGRF